jgi:aspartyl-tRNA(Asn)/glutamyl-tRNA(Gln) amidotransferase subunit A
MNKGIPRRQFGYLAAGASMLAAMPGTTAPQVSAETTSAAREVPELNRLDAGELAARIAHREISPVEAVDAALSRLEAIQPALNAFIFINADGARSAAREAEAALTRGEPLGPLHGVPISVKDLIEVAHLPVQYGSLTMKGNVAEVDAVAVERLRKAGAIILGKTATPEFGYTGITKSPLHGITRNPWNIALTPGGSSGGATASVAAGVTPIAIGTDGGGSIRIPSAFSGVVGVKAQYARVPMWPAGVNPTILHTGPIARSASDAALLLGVIAGPDRRDSFSLQAPLGQEADTQALRTLRIAFSPTLGAGKVDAAVADTVAAAVTRLQVVFPLIETVSDDFPNAAEFHASIFYAGISARFGDLVERSPDLIDPPLLAGVKRFREMSVDRYTRLVRRQVEYRDIMGRFFERYDLLLTPTVPCIAFSAEQAGAPGGLDYGYFTRPFNHTGQPAASIPCGLTTDSLPVGLQIVAQSGGEATLIAAMRAAETVLRRLATPIQIKS